MKLKVYVVDMEIPPRAKRWALRIGLLLALTVGGVAVVVAAPKTWSAGDTLTAADLNASFSAVQVTAHSVERSGAIAPNTAAWTQIPGLTMTFTLAQSSLVQMTTNGVQRTTGPGATTICNASYRYVVDGVPKGHATNGQRTHVTTGDDSHSTWTAIDFGTLAAGQHTIAFQARNPSPNGMCYICAEFDGTLAAYDSCTMNVVAVPQ